jgi:hypothetical protein
MISVYSPLGLLPPVKGVSLSRLPIMSDAVTIAILDNSKHNFGALMDRVAAVVSQKYPEVQWHIERKPGAAHPAPEDIRERILEHANVVFTGSGD